MTAAKSVAAQCFSCLDLGLEKFKRKAEVTDIDGLPALLNEGFALVDLVDRANVMFGGVLFLTYFVGIVSTIAGLFFSVNFVIAAIGENLTPTIGVLSAMSVCIVLCGQIPTWGFANLGQAMGDAFGDNKRALEQLEALKDDIPDSQRRELKLLINLFSNPAPIRPWDTFDLNHSSTLSIMNTLLTYLVILLQFKGQ